ncbi:MAG TPA: hypothetical protein VFJ20_11370 [Gemmatimonadaceae bacterium]|nr:hypothetical protein [Gemmatimonadaceae bacterium]
MKYLVVVVTLCARVAAAEPSDDSDTPPLSASKIAGEALVGSLFATGGGVIGAYAGYGIDCINDCRGWAPGVTGPTIGGYAGLTLTAPLGVYLAGTSGNETGSLGATYLGALAGAGIGVLAGLSGSRIGELAMVLGPSAGAMIGFNLTRRYRPEARRSWAPTAVVSSERTIFGIGGRF